MLEKNSIEFIKAVAKKYGASRVLLFGSTANDTAIPTGDIDLAVEGLNVFAHDEMWGDLMWAEELNKKNVDLIRIEDQLPINAIIENRGILVYAAS